MTPVRVAGLAVSLGLGALGCGGDAFVLDLVDAGAQDAPRVAARYDYCTEIPPLAEAPQLDGLVDQALPLAPIPESFWHAEDGGSTPLPDAFSASFAAAWRPDGLYVVFDVTDPDRVPAPVDQPVWHGDGVEVYVDDDGRFADPVEYDDPGTRHLLYGEATGGASGVRVERTPRVNMLSVPWPSGRARHVVRQGGYIVEAFVAAADLDLPAWQLSAGQSIGFDVSINVSFPAPIVGQANLRLGSYALRVDESRRIPESFPFNTTRAFCLPLLRAAR